MSMPEYSPYRSEAARDSYLAYYDSLALKRWPVASEKRMVPTSYGETFVRISGPADAPPLVLLPGAVATSLMWAPNIRELSDACRTYAVDMIGDVGRTTCTKPVRRVYDLLAWLDELFDALDLREGICLTGASYGGWLTLQYAAHAPQRLNAAIPLEPGGSVLRINVRFMASLIIAGIFSRWLLPPLCRWIFADMARKDPQWLDDLLGELRMGMRSLAPRSLPMPPVWTDAEWQTLSVPTLFLVGEHETIYDPEKAVSRLRRVAPQVATEIIPGAGHDLSMAQAEMVNGRIIEFVKQHTVLREPAALGSR